MALIGAHRLLDMLNVRYILVPISLSPLPDIAAWTRLVFQDAEVYVYENLGVMLRSKIVHDVQPSQEGLELEALRWGTAVVDQAQVMERCREITSIPVPVLQ